MTRPIRILVAATDEQAAMRQALERRDFAIVDAADFTRAYALLVESQVDLIVIQSAGQPQDGTEFIRRVRATPRLTGILILVIAEWGTGHPTLALSAGADAYEPNQAKPIDPSRLITSIERLLSRQVAAAN